MSNRMAQATISEEMRIDLEDYMMKENRSKSQVVRMALSQFLGAEKDQPAIALALVELVAQINKLDREYADVLPKEYLDEINEKLAVLVAVERG